MNLNGGCVKIFCCFLNGMFCCGMKRERRQGAWGKDKGQGAMGNGTMGKGQSDMS